MDLEIMKENYNYCVKLFNFPFFSFSINSENIGYMYNIYIYISYQICTKREQN